MKTVGIICEYHPFHYGHLRQVEAIRAHFGDCAIIALMSGNFVQRGEVAYIDKYTRARMAIECGVDAVFELPFPYAMGGAFYFAQGAIRLAKALHLDAICFGSESDPAEIETAARRLASPAFVTALAQCNDKTTSLALRRSRVYQDLFGTSLSDLPNDILAMEYYQSIWREEAQIEVFALRREGDWSATASRRALRAKDDVAISHLLPAQVCALLPDDSLRTDVANLDRAILAYFRLQTAQELRRYAEWTLDAANAFVRAAQKASSTQELLTACRSKRYSDARLRRMLWSALTQITENDLKSAPSYTLLLAASARGTTVLRNLKKAAELSILTKPAHIRRQSTTAQKAFALCERAQVWFSLAQNTLQDADAPMLYMPYIHKKKGSQK